ncbi:MAG: RNA polymerase sigma factor [Candidatus Excrementavichristensenella sp.]|jgi:DNA-directed RNA polymerase specialized sigma24 family protein
MDHRDDPAVYLERVGSIYVSLFRMAHAITGNREIAAYVFRSAIVEAYLRRKEWQGRMSFQDGLERTVRGVALAELKRIRAAGRFEVDWILPEPVVQGAAATRQALLELLEKESEVIKRIAMLYYACQLSHRQIAQVMQLHTAEVSGKLHRLSSRLLRALKLGGQRGMRSLEDHLEALLLSALNREGEEVPEPGVVFRSFERDVMGATRPRTSLSRVIVTLLKLLGALVLAALIWLLAVLLEPSPETAAPHSSPDPEVQSITEVPP